MMLSKWRANNQERFCRKAKPNHEHIDDNNDGRAEATYVNVEGEIACHYQAMYPDDKFEQHDDSFYAFKVVSDPDTLITTWQWKAGQDKV